MKHRQNVREKSSRPSKMLSIANCLGSVWHQKKIKFLYPAKKLFIYNPLWMHILPSIGALCCFVTVHRCSVSTEHPPVLSKHWTPHSVLLLLKDKVWIRRKRRSNQATSKHFGSILGQPKIWNLFELTGSMKYRGLNYCEPTVYSPMG